MQQLILAALAAWHGLNGALMLTMPRHWYDTVPGVTHTGPFNGHFIADIAFAFLASAAGLALAVRQTGLLAAALLFAPAIFLGGHALLHAVEFLHGHFGAAAIVRDAVLIVLPGLMPAILAWRFLKSAKTGEISW